MPRHPTHSSLVWIQKTNGLKPPLDATTGEVALMHMARVAVPMASQGSAMVHRGREPGRAHACDERVGGVKPRWVLETHMLCHTGT